MAAFVISNDLISGQLFLHEGYRNQMKMKSFQEEVCNMTVIIWFLSESFKCFFQCKRKHVILNNLIVHYRMKMGPPASLEIFKYKWSS